jgi:hypothetical protein
MKFQFKVAKANEYLDFDTKLVLPEGDKSQNSEATQDQVNQREELLAYCMQVGVQPLCSRGMAAIGTRGLEGAELEGQQAKALEVAKANLQKIYDGKIRIVGKKKTPGGDRAITAAARRIARDIVKENIKAAGLKLAHYTAKQITEAADDCIASAEDNWIIEQAKEEIAARSKPTRTVKFDPTTLVADPKLVEKAEARKREKVPLSAKQAAKPASRQTVRA